MDIVYFVNAIHERGKGGLSQKYTALLKSIELNRIITRGKKVAIKLHMGERGNIRYIRPYFVRLTVDAIKEIGGYPFIFDTTVIYPGKRETKDDYLETARMNGFSEDTMDSPIIIADKNDEGIRLPVKNPFRLKEIFVGKQLIEADVLVNLTHFTFHPQFPFAAGVKNLGMGCVLQISKDAMHTIKGTKPRDLGLWEATVDGAKTILDKFGSNAIHINFLIDITEDCDCFSKSNIPLIADIGIAVSKNLFALDFASFDIVKDAPPYPGGKLEGKKKGECPLQYLNKKDLSFEIFREVIKKATGYDGRYELKG